jgi:hypothetical protein
MQISKSTYRRAYTVRNINSATSPHTEPSPTPWNLPNVAAIGQSITCADWERRDRSTMTPYSWRQIDTRMTYA